MVPASSVGAGFWSPLYPHPQMGMEYWGRPIYSPNTSPQVRCVSTCLPVSHVRAYFGCLIMPAAWAPASALSPVAGPTGHHHNARSIGPNPFFAQTCQHWEMYIPFACFSCLQRLLRHPNCVALGWTCQIFSFTSQGVECTYPPGCWLWPNGSGACRPVRQSI